MANPEIERDPVEVLAEQFLDRFRKGENPTISEYADAHPTLAARIVQLFPTLLMMEKAASPPATLPSNGSPPQNLGDYRILREVGRGGMGIVYEAVQVSLGRHVALKLLPFEVAANPMRLERFRREARAAARLHHTNIVPVFEIGEHQGTHYYAMQFIQGLGLDEVMQELIRLRSKPEPDADHDRQEFSRKNGSGSNGSSHKRRLVKNLLTGTLAGQAIPISSEVMRGNSTSAALSGFDLDCPVPITRLAPSNSLQEAGLAEHDRPDSADDSPQRASAPLQSAEFSLPVHNGWIGRKVASIVGRSQVATDSNGHFYRCLAQVGVQVAEALEYAHGQQILHRDIKPANLLLTEQGTVWVTDFGLAKDEGSDLTKTGDLVGTLRYMAPERLRGEGDARSDVYSLGLVLYELLTLRRAFDELDPSLLIKQISHDEPVPPRKVDPRIPRDLETIALKAIAKEQTQRYQSAAQLAEDLRRFIADRPVLARRHSFLELTWRWCRRNPALATLSAALVLAVLFGFGGVLWKWQEAEEAQQLANERAEYIRLDFDGLMKAQVLLDSARTNREGQHCDSVNADFTEALRLRPENETLWAERAEFYATLGLWDLASHDYSELMKLREPLQPYQWSRHALLCLYLGDVEGYRATCKRMRQFFVGTPKFFFSREVVRICALDPDPAADTSLMVELSQTALPVFPQSWYQNYTLGATLYRAGRYEEAIHYLQNSITVEPQVEYRRLSYPLLAMAYHQLGKTVEARQALASASQTLEDWTRSRYQDQGYNWVVNRGATAIWVVPWWDWLEFQVYYREAMCLITGSAPPEDPRMIVLRARSLAGLRWIEEAEKEYEIAVKLLPGDVRVRIGAHVARAGSYVAKSDWVQAAIHYKEVAELNPEYAPSWRFCAVAQLAAGDEVAYQQTCEKALTQFEKTSVPVDACTILLTCVLRDNALSDMKRLRPLIEVAKSEWHFSTWTRGAALYRAGWYEESIQCFEEAAKLFERRSWEWCFLAMAHQRLGHTPQARQCLGEAVRWLEDADRSDRDNSGSSPTWGSWDDHVIFPLLLRETRQVLKVDAP